MRAMQRSGGRARFMEPTCPNINKTTNTAKIIVLLYGNPTIQINAIISDSSKEK